MKKAQVSGTLVKNLTLVSQWNMIAGAVALAIIMGIVVADVMLRAIFKQPIMGTVDIVRILLLIVIFSGLAIAELRQKHIRVEVLVSKFPQTVERIIVTNGYFLTISITSVVAWQCFVHAVYLKSSGLVTSSLKIPEWPFAVIVGFFMILFSLALVVSFSKQLIEFLSIKGEKAYFWLLPGIALSVGFFALSLWPSLLPFEISVSTWAGIVVSLLFIFIFLKVHIALSMALVALLGISYMQGSVPGLSVLAIDTIRVGSTYAWTVVPLFMLMGLLVFHAGFARDLYAAAYSLVGNKPGGLASATVLACTGLAAVVGETLTGVITMGAIALPEMKRYKYAPGFSTAVICVSATLGILIPPSMGLIVYGMLTETSIAKLFIAGILPGILFTSVLITLVTLICKINPTIGPAGPATSWKEKVVAVKDVWAVVVLIIVVLGGLYMGIMTPNEGGAIGAFGAMVIGLAVRRLNFKKISDAALEAIYMTSEVMIIFVFAMVFSRFLSITNLPYNLANWVIGLGLSPYGLITVILLIYVVLGCLMNALPVVILTVPIFFPIIIAAGLDPLWFGVLVVVMIELAVITPPIGMNVFAMSAIATDVPMYTIFRSVVPFWVAYLVLIVILVLFPQISLFLPSLMR